MDIIVDRKKKRFRYGMDENWTDPLGIDQAKQSNANKIDILKGDKNIIYEFIRKWGSHKQLLGKKAYCLTDKKEILSGYIVDVMPPDLLHLRNKGVVRFKDCISLEEK